LVYIKKNTRKNLQIIQFENFRVTNVGSSIEFL